MIVVWRVTERCNLSCAFCAYDRTLELVRQVADPRQIERFGAVLAEYQRVSADKVLVSWIGGEPLLWSGLKALTVAFRENYGLAISTTTNGTPLGSATLRAHLLEHYEELTVSVDALGETHDRLRNSAGLFSRIRAAVGQLVQERQHRGAALKLRINVVLMRSTIDAFPELCRELAEWGIDEITFNALGGRDRPEFFPSNRVLPHQLERFAAGLLQLRTGLQDRGVELAGGADYLERLIAGSRDQPMPVIACAPGERFLFIDEQGRVAPCSFTGTEYGVALDTLRSALDLQQLPLAFARAQAARRTAACDDCPSTHVFAKFASAPAVP